MGTETVPYSSAIGMPLPPPGTEGAAADAFVLRTLATMRGLALEGAASPRILELARHRPTAAAIRRYLEEHVVFVFDPPDLEYVQAPGLMVDDIERLGQAAGDCDDIATLGAALGAAAGLPARFRVIGFDAAGPYQHVYAELLEGGAWRELDTSRPDQFLPGFHVRRAWTLPVQ